MPTLVASPFAFNPLKFANKLKDAGIPDKQAEAEADALHEALAQQSQAVSALENRVLELRGQAKHDAAQAATKGDMGEVRTDMAALRKEMASKDDLRKEIALARRDIIIWLGGVLVVGFGLILRMLSKLPV